MSKNKDEEENEGKGAGFLGKLFEKVAGGTEFTLEGLAKMKSKGRDLRSPLNAVFGDKLVEMNNSLALPMSILKYDEGEYALLDLDKKALKEALPHAGDRICVFIHGLASSEKTWTLRRKGERPRAYAELLPRDTGHACFLIRYNTGRHISVNGRALAELLNQFVKAYPGKLREINLIGHSMGGLVSRSAAFYGVEAGHGWVKKLSRNFLLGSPLLGAHQEQIGKLTTDILDFFPATRLTARILDFRSAGIQDLGYGYLRDEDWNGVAVQPGSTKSLVVANPRESTIVNRRSPVPLIKNTRYYLIIGSVSKDPESIIGSFLGDGVVNRPSARGEGSAKRYEEYQGGEISEIAGLNHMNIPGDPRVYRIVRDRLRG